MPVQLGSSLQQTAAVSQHGVAFVYPGRPIGTMHNTAWQSARQRAGLPYVWVHDLKCILNEHRIHGADGGAEDCRRGR